ncbi:hypothetical protein yaldo0001_22230 [Yersinia aldovae ATCC 35236]|nr:hypothetical protein yaldo0001_22230 [Yersinia aldovae ATCC 35236]
MEELLILKINNLVKKSDYFVLLQKYYNFQLHYCMEEDITIIFI